MTSGASVKPGDERSIPRARVGNIPRVSISYKLPAVVAHVRLPPEMERNARREVPYLRVQGRAEEPETAQVVIIDHKEGIGGRLDLEAANIRPERRRSL